MNRNNLFKRAFTLSLEGDLNPDLAEEIANNLDGSPAEKNNNEIEALRSTLDNDVSPEDYLVDPATDKMLQQQIDTRNKEIASVIEGWTAKIDEFTDFLNGTDEDSLQSILAKAQPGTLFAKVQSSNSRKIASSAQELAALSQSLKSFIGQKAITQA